MSRVYDGYPSKGNPATKPMSVASAPKLPTGPAPGAPRGLGAIGPDDSKPRQANSEGHIEPCTKCGTVLCTIDKMSEDFFEEDEPVEEIELAFEKGGKSVILPPPDALKKASQALSRVRSLHCRTMFPGDDKEYCDHCTEISGGRMPYPCYTLLAIIDGK